MKKRVCLWIAMIMVLLMGEPRVVYGDLIWEPEDTFYQQHADECENVNRSYTANGPEGEVTIYESPESAKVVGTLTNGETAHVSFTYKEKGGADWGICEPDEAAEMSGWVPMDYMKVVYDYISFAEEHGTDIITETNTIEISEENQEIIFWNYPGSMEYQEASFSPGDSISFDQVFQDTAGHKWAFLGYFQGWRNLWVCMDSPKMSFEELYPDGDPGFNKEEDALGSEPEEDTKEDVQGSEPEIIKPDTSRQQSMLWIIGGVVLAVIVITGGILLWMKKSKK